MLIISGELEIAVRHIGILFDGSIHISTSPPHSDIIQEIFFSSSFRFQYYDTSHDKWFRKYFSSLTTVWNFSSSTLVLLFVVSDVMITTTKNFWILRPDESEILIMICKLTSLRIEKSIIKAQLKLLNSNGTTFEFKFSKWQFIVVVENLPSNI